MVWRGPAGWAEWSPFLDYSGAELLPWLRAADEAADLGWPEPVRTGSPVNCTVPAVGPEQAASDGRRPSGCRTAKVKVAEPGQTLADDLARVEAVRDALGPGGRVRVDANGGLGPSTGRTRRRGPRPLRPGVRRAALPHGRGAGRRSGAASPARVAGA